MPDPDPLDDARALLALARLLHRYRRRCALNGVQPADAAARATMPVGRKLAAAVKAAEEADTESTRAAGLEEVARAGVELWQGVSPAWEGVQGLISVAIDGVRRQKARRPFE